MKKLIIAIVALTVFPGCRYQQESTEVISVMTDPTDRRLRLPKIEDIWLAANFSENISKSVTVKFSLISDKAINIPLQYRIGTERETRKQLIANGQQRVQTVNYFHDVLKKVTDSLNASVDKTAELPYSEIFTLLRSELLTASRYKGSKYHILIYSDLRERGLFDSYSMYGITTDSLARSLQKKYPFPIKLRNVSISVFYQPRNRQDDSAFQFMFDVYKILLSNTGAELYLNGTEIPLEHEQ